jgi:iron complex transport system substrate-binding protein
VRDAEGNLVTLESAPAEIGIAGQAPARLADALAIQATRVDDGSGNLDLGTIRRLEPKLILSGSEINQAGLTRARALGIAIYVVPDRTLDGVEQALVDVGLLAGAPYRGRLLRDRVAGTREEVRKALTGTRRVRVFFNAGRFATMSSGSFIGSIISEAGGMNVAGPDPNEGPFPLERLARLRPQVLVLASNLTVTLGDLRRKRLARRLPAVRSGRIVRIDMRLLEPGPDAVDALRQLAQAFHPDAFR